MPRSFEVFYHPDDWDLNGDYDGLILNIAEDDFYYPGWYYWWCEPGCLPDSDPIGPFPTSTAATKEAKEELEPCI